MGRLVTRELIQLTLILVVVFLVLTHATGAARTLSAFGSSWSRVIRTFQGR
jgi:hypothetical protein